jgi:hypothetical protein
MDLGNLATPFSIFTLVGGSSGPYASAPANAVETRI